jgi:ABC-type transport system involved in multi-copper enzyme maturation permease subunit
VNNIWVLARMTFREAIRRRIVLTGVVLGVCFLIIFSAGLYFVTSQIGSSGGNFSAQSNSPELVRIARTEGINLLLLSGLYAVTFLSVAMAALLGADTLAGEISSGTIQTIVTKPIRRSDVVLGKWLGFVMLLALYVLLMAGGTVLSVLIQTGYTPDHLAAGLGLIYLEAILIMTISLACSSSLPALATGGIVFGLWGLSFIGGWIEQFGALLQIPTAIQVGIITSLIIPSESLWRRAAFEMQTPLAGALGMSPFGTISVPSLPMIAYAITYLLVALALSIRAFQNRDL